MWKCKKCGEMVEDQFDSCWKCSADKTGASTVSPEVIEEIEEEAKGYNESARAQYPALRLIAGVYKILAWLVAIGTLICIIMLAISRETSGVLLFVAFLGGAVGFVTLLAASESIMVFIDIEKNTRKAAENSKRVNRK